MHVDTVSLDIATTMGVYVNSASPIVFSIKGSPTYQWRHLEPFLASTPLVIVEDFTAYGGARSPVTFAQLAMRFGFLVNIMLLNDIKIQFYHVMSVRKHLGLLSKKTGDSKKNVQMALRKHTGLKLTTDEADAIAVYLFHEKMQISDLKSVTQAQDFIQSVK